MLELVQEPVVDLGQLVQALDSVALLQRSRNHRWADVGGLQQFVVAGLVDASSA